MPTFIFFRNKTKIDTLRGADSESLEEKVKKWYGSGDDTDDDNLVKGHVSKLFMNNSCIEVLISRLNVFHLSLLVVSLTLVAHLLANLVVKSF